jgi:hypothetical protein
MNDEFLFHPRVAGRGEAGNENPDTGSHHLALERVDIVGNRFALDGRVVVVGEVKIVLDVFLLPR